MPSKTKPEKKEEVKVVYRKKAEPKPVACLHCGIMVLVGKKCSTCGNVR